MLSATPDARLKYIGKQKDGESRLADHGVRKYDYNLGQFTSIDPLWEKLYLITNYELRMKNEEPGKRDRRCATRALLRRDLSSARQ